MTHPDEGRTPGALTAEGPAGAVSEGHVLVAYRASNTALTVADYESGGRAMRKRSRGRLRHPGHADRLAAALRPGGRVFIVDFSPTAHRGPPASMRVTSETVIAELESAGFSARVSPIAIPDQYIVEARRP